MAVYNTTFLATSNTFADIVTGINTASGGGLVFLLLTVIFIVTLARGIKNGDTTQGLIMSGLLTTIIGVLFWAGGLLAWAYLLIPFTILVGSIVVRFFQ